ncbi:MAG: rhomboid family intramembrane serine protease, partial [Flavobacteriales bacterium]|nr:rhomboid family intramembrane serine protease [Flavobacteriales bacterium]
GIISSLTSLWFNDFNIAIGASGAIFGLYGILIILLPTKIVESKNKTALIIGVVSFTIYNLISGFTNVLPKSDMFVDNAAHLGGFTAGLIFGIILYPSIRWTSNIVLSIFTQIILIVSVLGGGYYLLDKIPDNTTIYMDTLNEFTENENEALFIFRLSSYKYVDSYKDEITDIGIKNWEKNIYLLENLQKKADLQGIYAEKVEAYIHYCELRITQYEVMIQMLEVEENDSLNTEFNQLKSKIDSIITNYPM